MQLLRRSILAAGLLTMALMATMVQPASAKYVGTILFVVLITTPPLGTPTNAPNNGTIEIVPDGTCSGAYEGTPDKLAPITDAGLCEITGGGTVGASTVTMLGGWCGHSGGTITASVRFPAGLLFIFTIDFNTAGTAVVGTGTARHVATGQTGTVTMEADAVPPTPATVGGSCANGSATKFTVAGTATFLT